MEMTYDRLMSGDVRGPTQADYLVGLGAHLRITGGGTTILDEPDFPVAELARSLAAWLDETPRGDFELDSMSHEEQGVVAIRQVADGWVLSSAFDPGATTAPVAWIVVDECCRRFIARVVVDLESLGIDPAQVLKR